MFTLSLDIFKHHITLKSSDTLLSNLRYANNVMLIIEDSELEKMIIQLKDKWEELTMLRLRSRITLTGIRIKKVERYTYVGMNREIQTAYLEK